MKKGLESMANVSVCRIFLNGFPLEVALTSVLDVLLRFSPPGLKHCFLEENYLTQSHCPPPGQLASNGCLMRGDGNESLASSPQF